ncbi:sensor histidine kinase [Bacillus sp. 31A1R]|uniref:histidine kinase n=1 Tax=Robertmurraya mangrovi TaxID=3098077 RepID=A0ABU5IY10_9BACI|nr:sensor histidine kinase [Bacillus sp. 31A1R]MDZ5472043.1 sensor histidine kinase [Bacillus sp. 31A1R]
MKFINYLTDQRWLIITYFMIMFFISSVIYLDPHFNVHVSSFQYIWLITFIIFLIYLFLQYLQKVSFYKKISSSGENLILPKVKTFEQKIILEIIKSQQARYESRLDKLTHEKKEWIEFMTSWVHEIKTPISVSKMIFETDGNVESLKEEMDKIEHFIEQALYYSRLNDFSKDYLIQEVNVERLVKEVIKVNSKQFIAKKISLKLSLEPLEVLSDKKGLLFIINQLLLNSLKYTPSNGEIQILLQDRKLFILDNGIGIAEEDLPRVFERGFTGKNGRQNHASTGMGLYLAKRTSEKLGHQIMISSKEGDYTEAVVYFPELNDDYYVK